MVAAGDGGGVGGGLPVRVGRESGGAGVGGGGGGLGLGLREVDGGAGGLPRAPLGPALGVYKVLSTRATQLVQVLLGDRGNRKPGRQHCDLVPHDRGDKLPQLTPAAAVLVVAPAKRQTIEVAPCAPRLHHGRSLFCGPVRHPVAITLDPFLGGEHKPHQVGVRLCCARMRWLVTPAAGAAGGVGGWVARPEVWDL